MHIWINGKGTYMHLGETINEHWDQKSLLPLKKHPNYSRVLKFVTDIETRLDEDKYKIRAAMPESATIGNAKSIYLTADIPPKISMGRETEDLFKGRKIKLSSKEAWDIVSKKYNLGEYSQYLVNKIRTNLWSQLAKDAKLGRIKGSVKGYALNDGWPDRRKRMI